LRICGYNEPVGLRLPAGSVGDDILAKGGHARRDATLACPAGFVACDVIRREHPVARSEYGRVGAVLAGKRPGAARV